MIVKDTPRTVVDSYKYESFRYYLFCHSYTAFLIRDKFLKSHNLPKRLSQEQWFTFLIKNFDKQVHSYFSEFGLDKINHSLLWARWQELCRYIFPSLYNFCSKWKIDFHLFLIFLLYKNVPDKLDSLDHSKVITVYPNLPKEIDPGNYLRIDSTTTKDELMAGFKWAKIVIGSREDNLDLSQKNTITKKRKDVSKEDKKFKGKAYIKIEKKIYDLATHKDNRKDQYEYGKTVVEAAIEQVAGDLLEEMKLPDEIYNQRELQWKKQLRGFYYDVVTRYKLPKYKESSSILRDINF